MKRLRNNLTEQKNTGPCITVLCFFVQSGETNEKKEMIMRPDFSFAFTLCLLLLLLSCVLFLFFTPLFAGEHAEAERAYGMLTANEYPARIRQLSRSHSRMLTSWYSPEERERAGSSASE